MKDYAGKVALVTGANRGIGLEVVRQLARLGFTVLLGSRDAEKGARAAAPLAEEGLKVITVRLDVTEQESIDSLKRWAEERFGKLDVLVNNAGVLYDSWQRAVGADLKVCAKPSRRTRSGRGACPRLFCRCCAGVNTGAS